MLVTIWRHGEAAPGSPDRHRTLTARGRSDLQAAVPGFVAELTRRELPLPDRLLFSRWRRTAQTADLVGAFLPTVPREPLEALIPGSDTAAVETAITVFADRSGHLLLVSHQPLVSELVDHWLGSPGEVPALGPGSFAVIDLPLVAPGFGSLLWWSAPPDDGV